jgi:ABC-type cobalamin transport system ATPase subunit
MNHRLQVPISAELDAQLEKAVWRSRVSKGEWVRRALQESLRHVNKNRGAADPVARLALLNGPVADIDSLLAQIEAGRS